jgi:putative flavoprotein involved in K+ transport
MAGERRDADADADVLVVGAGPAGLAAAGVLARRGLEVRVLERAGAVAASWRERYDGLRLNTVRWLSSAPGLRMPRRYGRWVGRDDYVAYLERYALHHGLEIELDTPVERIDRHEHGWRLATRRGERTAAHVVVATGYYHSPRAPQWPGLEDFRGRVLHAADYRSAAPFRGQDVLVVGAGNTGTEIAQHLASEGARRVRLSVRTPPNIVPRELPLGLPAHPLSVLARPAPPVLLDVSTRLAARVVFGDLRRHGLRPAPYGVHTMSKLKRPPVIDAGFVRLVRRGRIEIVAAVESMTPDAVILADGARARPDTVIAAVGYERGLDGLVGHLGVLDETGAPLSCVPPDGGSAPGLYFVGFQPKLGGFLVDIGLEARRVGRAVGRAGRVDAAPGRR